MKSHKTTSSENNSTSVSVCQPQEQTTGQTTDLIKNLSQTSTDLCSNGTLLNWVGVDVLRNIIKQNQPCIVVGNERAGKGCAATLCRNGMDDSLIIMPLPVDTDEIFAQLWYWLDKPIPSIIHRNNITSEIVPFPCPDCKLECHLKTNPPWDKPDIAKWVLGDMTGKCLMKRYLVKHNLFKLRDKTVMLRIPDLDNDLLTLLNELLEKTTLIILATPKQKEKLDKQYRFRRLFSESFPKANVNFLLQQLASKVKDAGLNRSPFDLDVALLVSALSQQSIGEFNRILARILNQGELEGRTEQIDVGYALKVIMEPLDDKTKVLIALYDTEFKIARPGELIPVINKRSGSSPTARRIGEILHNYFGYQPIGKGRDSKGRRYQITKPTIPLLGVSVTDTREVLPEGDSEQ